MDRALAMHAGLSDDRRMSCMFDILNRVARKVQVIILTCREQLFEELGVGNCR